MHRVRLMSITCLIVASAVLAARGSAQEKDKSMQSKPTTQPAATQPSGAKPRVEMEIGVGDERWGRVVIELEEDKAPLTVKNFLKYVDDGYYDGTIFHRIIPTFMVQGGGFTDINQQKRTGLRDPIQNEAKNGLKNKRGTVAMARTAVPHSATSQFFINVVDNAFLDYPGADNWGYCVFGTVVEGMDVVDKLKSAPTKPGGEGSTPVNPPKIIKATRAK